VLLLEIHTLHFVFMQENGHNFQSNILLWWECDIFFAKADLGVLLGTDWQIKLYYYETVLEKYMESKLEVHRSKTLAEATEIAWKVSVAILCCLL